MSSSQDDQEMILGLKRRAVALKESGDTNGAMELLAQARDLEFQNASIDDLEAPLKLKQFAVVLKKKGDLEGAKQALMKAKQIEKGVYNTTDGISRDNSNVQQENGQQPQKVPQEQQNEQKQEVETTQPTQAPTPTPPKEQSTEEIPNASEEQKNEPQATEEELSNTVEGVEEAEVDPEEEEELLSELQVQKDGRIFSAEDNEELERLMNEQTFSVEEMTNHEMMTEFKLGGMPVPSDEDYQGKIMECKKAALAYKKAGDTANAMQELKQSKQLEQVRLALEQMNEGLGLRINDDQDGWIETLSQEESDLLGMSLAKKDPGDGGTGSKKDTMLNILEELADFMEDPNLLKDAIDMGMQVPDVEEIQAEALKQREKAIEHKQAGDLEAAKQALAQSKKLTAHGAQIEKVLEQMRRKDGSADEEGGGEKNMTLEDLEAMVEAEEDKKNNKGNNAPSEEPKGEKPKPKSSQELREEAICLRDAKKVKEATEVLKHYKEALKREEQEADMKQRQEMVQEISQEIKYAQQQIRVFDFYQRFVDQGSQQISLWNDYIDKCSKASKIVEGSGTDAIEMARKSNTGLTCAKIPEESNFNDIVTELVQQSTNPDPTDDRLEIAVLDVRGLQENSNLEKLLKQQRRENAPQHPFSIRVHVAVQLPSNEQVTDKPTEMEFESSTINPNESGSDEQGVTIRDIPDCYLFGESQYMSLPRGASDSYAKILRRRIERNKKIQISVYHVPKSMNKGGWLKSFVKSSKDEDLPPPTLLGKVTVGLQDLLKKRCLIFGDMDLMNGSGTKALGGNIGLGVRTGVPFATETGRDGEDVNALATTDAKLGQYEAMTFALKKQESSAEASSRHRANT